MKVLPLSRESDGHPPACLPSHSEMESQLARRNKYCCRTWRKYYWMEGKECETVSLRGVINRPVLTHELANWP
jgi:hypothetical protein